MFFFIKELFKHLVTFINYIHKVLIQKRNCFLGKSIFEMILNLSQIIFLIPDSHRKALIFWFDINTAIISKTTHNKLFIHCKAARRHFTQQNQK